jgi:SHS2 domain-containing protein
MARYRVLPHTADVGIAATGATVGEAFENAAFGMFDLMFDLAAADGEEVCSVEVEGDTREELLVAWLAALVAEAEIRGLALCRFEVQEIGGGRLRGRAAGSPAEDVGRRGPLIKAVTHHEAAVEEAAEGWEVRVIFDV